MPSVLTPSMHLFQTLPLTSDTPRIDSTETVHIAQQPRFPAVFSTTSINATTSRNRSPRRFADTVPVHRAGSSRRSVQRKFSSTCLV
ncbi:hypothetical protein PAXRUDRAFT_827775, partial [Paxillus rubicundulus Ve08.2h10]